MFKTTLAFKCVKALPYMPLESTRLAKSKTTLTYTPRIKAPLLCFPPLKRATTELNVNSIRLSFDRRLRA
jgi:hypothetical protein